MSSLVASLAAKVAKEQTTLYHSEFQIHFMDLALGNSCATFETIHTYLGVRTDSDVWGSFGNTSIHIYREAYRLTRSPNSWTFLTLDDHLPIAS